MLKYTKYLLFAIFNINAFAGNITLETGIGFSQENFNIYNKEDHIVKYRDSNAFNVRFGLEYSGNIFGTELKTDFGRIISGEHTTDSIYNYNNQCNCGYYSISRKMTGESLNSDLIFKIKANNSFAFRLGAKYKSLKFKPKGVYQIIKNGNNSIIIALPDLSYHNLNIQAGGASLGFEAISKSKSLTFGVKLDSVFIPNKKVKLLNWNFPSENGVYEKINIKSGLGFDLELFSIVHHKNFSIKYYSFFNYYKIKNSPIDNTLNQKGIKGKYKLDNLVYTKIGMGVNLLIDF